MSALIGTEDWFFGTPEDSQADVEFEKLDHFNVNLRILKEVVEFNISRRSILQKVASIRCKTQLLTCHIIKQAPESMESKAVESWWRGETFWNDESDKFVRSFARGLLKLDPRVLVSTRMNRTED